MPVIVGENKATYYSRQIQCPGNYMIPPGIDVYKREPVELLKRCSDFVEYLGQKRRIKKERIATDRWGNKIIDWKKVLELEKKGIVKWPWVSQAWAIEHVYDPTSVLCNIQCRHRWGQPCKEGRGRILERTIGRLTGRRYRG